MPQRLHTIRSVSAGDQVAAALARAKRKSKSRDYSFTDFFFCARIRNARSPDQSKVVAALRDAASLPVMSFELSGVHSSHTVVLPAALGLAICTPQSMAARHEFIADTPRSIGACTVYVGVEPMTCVGPTTTAEQNRLLFLLTDAKRRRSLLGITTPFAIPSDSCQPLAARSRRLSVERWCVVSPGRVRIEVRSSRRWKCLMRPGRP